jgi:hypothetical protein
VLRTDDGAAPSLPDAHNRATDGLAINAARLEEANGFRHDIFCYVSQPGDGSARDNISWTSAKLHTFSCLAAQLMQGLARAV